MTIPPFDFNVPFDPEAMSSNDKQILKTYFRDFHNALADRYRDIVKGITGESKWFQPVATNSAASASVSTYQKQTGIFHRLGNLVWFTIDIQWNSGDVTGSGDLYIDGLEIDTKQGTDLTTVFPVFDADQSDGSGVCSIINNSRRLFQFEIGAGANFAQVDADHDLTITGVYLVEQ